MSLAQRLERVEDASTEVELRRYAERLTNEWGMTVEQLAKRYHRGEIAIKRRLA